MTLPIEGDDVCAFQNYSCTFSRVNGGILTTLCIIGALLSAFTIYCLIYHVRLTLHQNLFILNVAVGDFVSALLGIVRGLGIIDPAFLGHNMTTDETNLWCKAYTFIGNTLWMLCVPVLIPLTVDRFIAVVFPFKYTGLMGARNCRIMVAFSWIPLLLITIVDIITIASHEDEITYQATYHRCVFERSREWDKFLFTVIPLIAIIIMYVIIVASVHKAKVETRKLIVMSLLIVGTSLVTYIPDVLLNLNVLKLTYGYKAGQILTVTLFYTSSIWNPLIYFGSTAQAKKVGRKISTVIVNRRVSNIESIEGKAGPVGIMSELPAILAEGSDNGPEPRYNSI